MFSQVINVTNGVQYALSAYLEAVSGSIGDGLLVTAGTATVTQNTFVTGPSSPGRYTILFTATGTGTINVRVGVGTSAGVGATVSATWSHPQCEAGAFPTSYIPTTTAAVTRSADVASITGSAFSSWFNASEFTVFADALRSYSGNFSGFPTVYNFHDGSDSNRALVFGTSNNFSPIATSGGVSQLDFVTTSASLVPGPNRLAHALGVNSSCLVFNGSSTAEDTLVTMPVGMNVLSIGAARTGLQWGGTIRRLTFWPQRLANSTLQAITQ
jgi:hypothetical protein